MSDVVSEARRVLDFWFEDTCRNDAAIAGRMAFWFSSNPRVDQTIGERFEALARKAETSQLDPWRATPSGRLALILLLDQFPRNLHRGTAAAFAGDEAALALCLDGLDDGSRQSLTEIEQVFLMMPMQHSESLAVQNRSVREYARLLESLEAGRRDFFRGFLDYARLHRDIIARFGRFPHRNNILGRSSTPEEVEYLGGNAPRFGQGQPETKERADDH